MDWFSLLLPLSYLTILIASLGVFSHLYRRRQTLRTARLEPWFGPHLTRQIYLSLLEQASAANEKDSKAPKIPDSVLRAALLRRAVTDIKRVLELRNSKQALSTLLQRGAVGDELWTRFQLAEKELEAELKDVVAEANALSGAQPGQQGQWGQVIFASAGEVAHAEMLSAKLEGIEAGREEERMGWEERKSGTRDEFLKEIGDDAESESVAGDEATNGSAKKKKSKA